VKINMFTALKQVAKMDTQDILASGGYDRVSLHNQTQERSAAMGESWQSPLSHSDLEGLSVISDRRRRIW